MSCDARNQGINTQDIDLIFPEYSGFTTTRVNPSHAVWFLNFESLQDAAIFIYEVSSGNIIL